MEDWQFSWFQPFSARGELKTLFEACFGLISSKVRLEEFSYLKVSITESYLKTMVFESAHL
jgi:hypothetical protein